MTKLYIIILPQTIERDKVIEYLKSINAISFWFYHLPATFFARSTLNAKQLQDKIVAKFPTERILIININSHLDYSGLVPNDHVQYFTNL